ncbi:DNA-methyltransferase [Planctomycetota bacterium]
MKIGLKFRESIIWHKKNSNVKNTAFGSFKSPSNIILRASHEHILIWSKEQWNLPNITEQEPDITKDEFLGWTYSVWSVMNNNNNKANHPAIFPEEIAKRLIKLYSYPGDLILDNFNGTGTTTAVANMLGRKYIGIDQNANYCKYAKERTEKVIRL